MRGHDVADGIGWLREVTGVGGSGLGQRLTSPLGNESLRRRGNHLVVGGQLIAARSTGSPPIAAFWPMTRT